MRINGCLQRLMLVLCGLWCGVAALRAEPVEPLNSQAVYDQITQGDIIKAVSLAQRLVRSQGDDVWSWVALANAHFAAKDVSAARSTVEKAIKRLGARGELTAVQVQLRATASGAKSKRQPPIGKPAVAPVAESGAAGWEAARQGYEAYDRGEHALAAKFAAQAVTELPDKVEYRDLLINALQSLKRPKDLKIALDAAIERLGPQYHWLSALREVEISFAAEATQDIFRALENHDLPKATQHAREAVAWEPDANESRKLLADLLLQTDQFEEAIQVVDAAIGQDPDDLGPLVLRAHIKHRQGDYTGAVADFERVLEHSFLDDVQQRWVRLIYADSAMVEGDWSRAKDVLAAQVMRADHDAAYSEALAQRRQALRVERTVRLDEDMRGAVMRQMPVLPTQNCRVTPYGRVCFYIPGVPSVDMGHSAASAAFAALAQKKHGLAVDQAQRALALAPTNGRYRHLLLDALQAADQTPVALDSVNNWLKNTPPDGPLLLRRADLLRALGQPDQADATTLAALAAGGLAPVAAIAANARVGRLDEARTALHLAMAEGLSKTISPLQLAYLAVAAGDDELAFQTFKREASSSALAPNASADAAFSALRLKLDTEAVSFFKSAIDARLVQQQNDPAAPSAQDVFVLQRSVAEVTRGFGWVGSLTMGRERGIAEIGLTGLPATSLSTVAGFEAYWRPWGYSNGRYIEPFLRGYAALHSSLGGPTGLDQGVYSAGLRAKLLTDHSLTLSAWQQLPITGIKPSDRAVQLSYFNGRGTDLRMDANAWWTWQVSADVGWYFKQRQAFASSDLRLGRSWVVWPSSRSWVLQVFTGLQTDHNGASAPRTSSALEGGVVLRHWFRGDRYTAPMSYTDIEWRHRLASTGGKLPHSSVLRLTTSY